ncbi:AAA family ATPase [Iamia majanohamensis]|uniref:AAA family ATPase n=1 Tax=Iamia majanohamensis TaxID=467976 RepID=A0AAE9YBL4_9ACTN|nr:AAA family ATPase [Iamia majanohamensis]WCO68098.1 AAA family ATPase [Iamia majanohamensis]
MPLPTDRPPGRARRPGPFVGRRDELSRLGGVLARAEAAATVAWVEGPSGIGKTALVRRALDEAPTRLRIAVSGAEDEGSLRFGVVDQLWTALEATAGPRPPAGPDADPLVVGADLLAVLGSLERPAVVVVDDLQWVDVESARALLFALRRLRDEPLAVVLAGHPDPGVRLGPGWAHHLGDEDAVVRIALGGVSAEDLVALAAGLGEPDLSPRLARRLRAHTDGHPLHARALLEEHGVAGLRRAGRTLPAPRSLATVVADRVGGLADGARGLVQAGAVLGRTFTVDAAARVAAVDDPVAALDAAVEAGLLEEVDGVVAFTHPLVRAATAHGTGPLRRQVLHEAAATVTSGTAALLHRAAAASGPAPDVVAALEAEAADLAAAGDHARAADLLEVAAPLASSPAERDRLVLDAAVGVHAAGDFVRLDALRPRVDACAPGPRRTVVEGLAAFAVNDPVRAEALLGRAVGLRGDPGGGPWASRAAATLALARVQLTDWEGACDAAEVTLAGDSPWDRSVARYALALSCAQVGDTDRARRAAPGPVGDGRGPGALDDLAAAGVAALYAGDLAAAEEALGAVARRARAGEPVHLHEVALANLAHAQHRRGRLDDAAFHAELAVALATDAGRPSGRVAAHGAAAAIAADRGRLDEADAHLAEAAAVPGLDRSRLGRLLVALARAAVADAREDPEAVVAALGAELDGRVEPWMATVGPPTWRALVVGGLVGTGRGADACAALALVRAADVATTWPLRADLARAEGRLAASEGRVDEAEAAYRSGLVADADGPPGPAGARLEADLGRLLVDQGRRRDAVEHLRSARQAFARSGAAAGAARCDEDLARCGLPVRAGDDDPLLLTDAELRVARLVADGATNRAAAAELFVSPKTVEFHLANVYAKLGISSRRDLPTGLGRPDR